MSDVLTIGKSGLFAAKKSLETTGHNISNANTEGYSRQRVNQTTNPPIAKSGYVEGTGVRITNVKRIHDPFIEQRLNNHISNQEYFKERTDQLEKIEHLFNEIDSEGLSHVLNKFFNSFKELANQPENDAVRSIVRDSASEVARDFRKIRESLNNFARTIDMTWEKNINDINKIMHHIAELNKEIVKLEVIGGETGDIRDQRDLAIRNLSEMFDIKTYLDNRGNFVVAAKNVGTLVCGTEISELSIGSSPEGSSTNKMAGSRDIYLKRRPNRPITNNVQKGSIAAMAKIKNADILKLQQEIDSLAYEFIKSVNAIHRRGYVNRTLQLNEQGDPVSFDEHGPTTGINFFKEPNQRHNAALLIDLSREVKADLTNLTAALSPNSPGDNRVALAISKLQDEKLLHEGTRTLQEQYLQLIGNIGLETGKARLDRQHASGILAQTHSFKERLSGVSLDEEAANMMRYQHAYDAAAKVLRAAEETFQTLINIKR